MTAGMALAVLLAVAWPLALAAYAMLHPQQPSAGEGSIPGLKLPDAGAAAAAEPSPPPPSSGTSGSAAVAPASPAPPAAAPADVAREAAVH